jgi:hypothetical protein
MVTNESLHDFSTRRRQAVLFGDKRRTLRSSLPISQHVQLGLHTFTIRLHHITLRPIMCLSPLLGGFKRRQPQAPPPDYSEKSAPPSYESPSNVHDRAEIASALVSSGPNICVDPTTLIPRGVGRGKWNRKQTISFSHLLSEDPSIAVFSKTQNAPVPAGWREKRGGRLWKYVIRDNWRELRVLPPLAPYAASLYTDKACLNKASGNTPVHWNPSAGVLLVNWMDLHEDTAKWNAQLRAQESEMSPDADEKTLVTISGVSADLKSGGTDEKKE